jgi:flagellar basal body-associated protein FliL
MNFFERQDAARKGSRALVIVFLLAVVCIVVAINAVLAVVWVFMAAGGDGSQARPRAGSSPSSRSLPWA